MSAAFKGCQAPKIARHKAEQKKTCPEDRCSGQVFLFIYLLLQYRH
jgi:hypothetical protein